MKTKRISSLELGRIISIIGVITIHTGVFHNLILIDGQPWITRLLNQASRFAVPFFFILSGYFIQPKLAAQPFKTLTDYSKPLLKLWLIWSAIYLVIPRNIGQVLYRGYLIERINYWQRLARQPLIKLLFQGGEVHLWFLLALICALVIISFTIRLNACNLIVLIAIALYIYGLMAGSYQPIFGLEAPFNTRLGPFFSTLLVVLGYEFRRKNFALPLKTALIVMTFGTVLHFTEAFYLIQWGMKFEGHDFLLGTPIWAMGMFFTLLAVPQFGANTRLVELSKYTLGIYLCHYIIIIYLRYLYGFLKINAWFQDLTLIPMTFLVSLIFIKVLSKTPLRNLLTR
ncbi:MAG: acyltransferase family protein [Okeania sp. SIO3B5]|uniref:acyltransferase n=1 Tax=Okeania sp. SIO3B5 TaxID=2607811 RepID=UPI0013FF41B2|nr:acyltransferase family protein [Okeania sp. SIO3B5]NEO56075.1 acyltransferase family protein [Okeania sp. SIO3B5]